MKLYTKTGDDGSTGLIGGVRVPKNHPRVQACGLIDETNAAIGVVIATTNDAGMIDPLRRIQADLFVVGAQIATPDGGRSEQSIGHEDVVRLEQWIDGATDSVCELKSFILPGGCKLAAALHLARSVCRRAERDVVSLAQTQEVGAHLLAYLNRLADLLFALARVANDRAGVADIPWSPA